MGTRSGWTELWWLDKDPIENFTTRACLPGLPSLADAAYPSGQWTQAVFSPLSSLP